MQKTFFLSFLTGTCNSGTNSLQLMAVAQSMAFTGRTYACHTDASLIATVYFTKALIKGPRSSASPTGCFQEQ